MLAMLAVGVFAYVLGGRALWIVPSSFVGMMLVGFLLGAAQAEVPFVELGIVTSSIVIGACAALGRPMPTFFAATLVAIFALFHGVAHGSEMPVSATGASYALGFMASTAALHLSGIAAAFAANKIANRHGRPIAQMAGAVFALGGVGMLAGWL